MNAVVTLAAFKLDRQPRFQIHSPARCEEVRRSVDSLLEHAASKNPGKERASNMPWDNSGWEDVSGGFSMGVTVFI